MKKLLYLFITTSLFLSCATEDIPTIKITQVNIKGQWKVSALESVTETTIINQGTTTSSITKTTGKDFDFVYDFKLTPNNVISQGNYTEVASTTVNGKTIIEETPLNNIPSFNTGTWQLENNTISIVHNGIKQTAIIEELTNNLLVLKINIDQSFSVQGATTTITGYLSLTMEK